MRRPKHSKKHISKLEGGPKHVTGHHIRAIKSIEEKLLHEISNNANKIKGVFDDCRQYCSWLITHGGPRELRYKTPMKTTFHVV